MLQITLLATWSTRSTCSCIYSYWCRIAADLWTPNALQLQLGMMGSVLFDTSWITSLPLFTIMWFHMMPNSSSLIIKILWLLSRLVELSSMPHNITQVMSCVHGPHSISENKASGCWDLSVSYWIWSHSSWTQFHQLSNVMHVATRLLASHPMRIFLAF